MKLKKRTFLILMVALTATFASAQKQSQPEWQSQYAVGLNKLAPHTYVWPYADASDIEKPGGYEESPYYMSLNGKWKFHWVKITARKTSTSLLIIPEDGRILMCPATGNDRDMEQRFMLTKLMSLTIRCSTSRRIRRWYHLPKTKSVLIVVHSKYPPTGKDAG